MTQWPHQAKYLENKYDHNSVTVQPIIHFWNALNELSEPTSLLHYLLVKLSRLNYNHYKVISTYLWVLIAEVRHLIPYYRSIDFSAKLYSID